MGGSKFRCAHCNAKAFNVDRGFDCRKCEERFCNRVDCMRQETDFDECSKCAEPCYRCGETFVQRCDFVKCRGCKLVSCRAGKCLGTFYAPVAQHRDKRRKRQEADKQDDEHGEDLTPRPSKSILSCLRCSVTPLEWKCFEPLCNKFPNDKTVTDFPLCCFHDDVESAEDRRHHARVSRLLDPDSIAETLLFVAEGFSHASCDKKRRILDLIIDHKIA